MAIGAEILIHNGSGGRNLFYPKTDYENIVDAQDNPAAAHNGLYRGKDLTSYFNSGEMSAAIADGSFKDIYPGDYIIKTVTIDGVTYADTKFIVMDLDYFCPWCFGDSGELTHHVVIDARGCSWHQVHEQHGYSDRLLCGFLYAHNTYSQGQRGYCCRLWVCPYSHAQGLSRQRG